ncbi:MAG: hypothetical protein DYH17_00365 [Xanthomonadales bacterium PRO6]|nr:hypothetical protein [Xanthomonadales bacterium PRO6]
MAGLVVELRAPLLETRQLHPGRIGGGEQLVEDRRFDLLDIETRPVDVLQAQVVPVVRRLAQIPAQGVDHLLRLVAGQFLGRDQVLAHPAERVQQRLRSMLLGLRQFLAQPAAGAIVGALQAGVGHARFLVDGVVHMLALCPPAGHAPLVLALMGLPGAGKSTLAQALAAAARFSILDRDEIRAGIRADDASDALREEADRLLLRRVGSGVRAALNLIVDGKSWARAGDRAALAEAVEDAGGDLVWCWLDLPPEAAIARVQADREHPAPDRNARLVLRVAARFEPPPPGCWRFDALLPPAEIVRQVLLRVAGRLDAILIEDRPQDLP